MRRVVLLTVLPVLLVVGLASCTVVQQQRQREEELQAANVVLDRTRIYISPSEVTDPHTVLGKLGYTVPFSPQEIETDYINDKLRKMAVEKWGNQVDALQDVHSDVNDSGSEVTVSAIGIQISGDCSYCRHHAQTSVVPVSNPQDQEVPQPKFQIGDQWVERIQGQDKTVTVAGVSGSQTVLDFWGNKATIDQNANLVDGFSWLNNQKLTFVPNLGTLQFPLKAGKQWTEHWQWKSPDFSGEGETLGKVVGWESITVPYGTVDAVKVDIQYRGRAGADMSCWWVPQVNGFAKCDILIGGKPQTLFELVSYQRAGPA